MNHVEAGGVRVAVVRCGDVGPGQHDVDAVAVAVAALGPAPDILCLSGAADLRLHGNAALHSLTHRLNELLTGNCYYPFLSDRPDSRNPPGLWLSAGRIRVLTEHHFPQPGDAAPASTAYLHTVEALIAGRRVWLKAEHWRGYSAPQEAIAHLP